MKKKKDTNQTATLPFAHEHEYFFGHREALATIVAARQSGRMHHAWLIGGPKGIGKATLAYRMARAILSESTDVTLAVGEETPTFRRVKAGAHADVLVLAPEEGKSSIGVEEARKVGAFLRMTPAETKYRVVIIDAIDDMNANAANAILKLLEEPPANAFLLLVSHAPGKLLPTIRSRCRQLNLRGLQQEDALQVLAKVAPQIPQNEAAQVMLLAGGVPGFAITLYEAGALALFQQVIALVLDRKMLNIHDIIAAITKGDAGNWAVAMHLLERLLFGAALVGAGQAVQTVSFEETQAIEALCARFSPLQLADKRAEIQALAARTEAVHLDKRLVLMEMAASL